MSSGRSSQDVAGRSVEITKQSNSKMKLYIPADYRPTLASEDMEEAIKMLKRVRKQNDTIGKVEL